MACGGWEPIGERLGEDGQGVVYKARSPESPLRTARQRARDLLLRLTAANRDEGLIPEFLEMLPELGQDRPEHLGALKVFKIPTDDPEEAKRARGRLESEISALDQLKHPGILKLLAHSAAEEFIVTEYHPGGTLDKHLNSYKGEALKALEAFRPLVEAVAEIHKQRFVHRDIKPENVFVASDGRLVLGDFGIVIFADSSGRLTKTYGERVGSHWWMAPWAYEPRRLEDANFTLDVFPLAKVLWSMVAGKSGFAYWEWDRAENNLEKMFPDDPAMQEVNGILSRSVVREEEDCLRSGSELLDLVNGAIAQLRLRAERPSAGRWRCRVCGIGSYVSQRYFQVRAFNQQSVQEGSAGFNLFVCDHCRNVQLFQG